MIVITYSISVFYPVIQSTEKEMKMIIIIFVMYPAELKSRSHETDIAAFARTHHICFTVFS